MRTRSGLLLQPTDVAEESQEAPTETPTHAAAVAAAASNPRRRHGKAKVKSLIQPLVNWHRLPDYLQDNEFIVGHYRPGHWTWQQITFSLFRIHNETFNIWSHLVGFLVFLGLCFVTVAAERKAIAEAVAHHVPRWPIYVFFAGAMYCHLASSVCHLLGCLPSSLTRLVWRFDYVGIAALIVTSYFPPVYYGFLCHPLWQNLYLWSISVFGLATVCLSLMDFFQQIRFRTLRALVFTGLGGFGFVVVAHQAAMHFHIPMVQEALILDGLMGGTYLLGATLYATRVPERWSPGNFDLALNSHNVFHLCVSVAAYVHYEASLVFIRWRENETCQ